MEHIKIVKPNNIKDIYRNNFILIYILMMIMRSLIYAVITVKFGSENLQTPKSAYMWVLLWSAIDGIIMMIVWKVTAIISFKDKVIRKQEIVILKSYFTMFTIVICVFISIVYLNNYRNSIQEYKDKLESYGKYYSLFLTDEYSNLDNFKEKQLQEFKSTLKPAIAIRILLGIVTTIFAHNCIRKNIESLGITEESYNELLERDRVRENKEESSYSSDEMET